MGKRKNKGLPASSKLANATQIPFDMASKQPYIKMFSNREVVIEDAGNLVHYDDCCIKVKQHKNIVFVNGSNLKLICLVNNDLRVTGFINNVGFE